MSDFRVGVAITMSLLLHGAACGWWYSDSLKYKPPSPRAIGQSVLRFDVVKTHSIGLKVFKPQVTDTIGLNGFTNTPVSPPPVTPVPSTEDGPTLASTEPIVPPYAAADPLQWGDPAFFTTSEVDVPATPVGDWVIDFSLWPPGPSPAIIIEMWISATGKLEHWELVGDMANREMAEMSLRELDRTPINPAQLNGQRVASFRRIEIVLDIVR